MSLQLCPAKGSFNDANLLPTANTVTKSSATVWPIWPLLPSQHPFPPHVLCTGARAPLSYLSLCTCCSLCLKCFLTTLHQV
jgi:hypothetical protein